MKNRVSSLRYKEENADFLPEQGKGEQMVTINGEQKDAAGMTVQAYLEQEGYGTARVVVERNLNILPGDELDKVLLEDGDTVEILRFVGGG